MFSQQLIVVRMFALFVVLMEFQPLSQSESNNYKGTLLKNRENFNATASSYNNNSKQRSYSTISFEKHPLKEDAYKDGRVFENRKSINYDVLMHA